MGASTRRCGAVCEHLERRRLLAATMLQDIGTTTLSSNPGNAVAIGSTVFFAAQDATHGKELWKTDGTAAGTQLVKDIFPGVGDSYPAMLTNVNGTLFFVARGPDGHSHLWKSDGTDAGTVAVKTLPVDDGFAESPLVVNGKLFFYLEFGFPRINVLWVSDGTADGTFALTPSTSSAAGALTGAPGAAGGAVYFPADDGVGDLSIWKTDGTPGGTRLLQDFRGVAKNYVPQLTGLGDTMFFDAPDGATPSVLWETNGTFTSGGTRAVSDSALFPLHLTDVGGTLFFSAWTHELWKSDGTSEGTTMVADVDSGGVIFQPDQLTPVGNELYFDLLDRNGTATGKLWKSDGTSTGTTLVKDFSTPTYFPPLNGFTAFADKLYFTGGYSGQALQGLWSTDGTAAGTQLLTAFETFPTTDTGTPFTYTPATDKLFFSADDTLHGFEPWVTDGTPAGTHLVLDINTIDVPSYPAQFVQSGGSVFFTTNATDLWKTDGTPAGTSLVRGDINPTGQAYIEDAVDVNGTLFFSADDGTHGQELWKSDGTAAGTQLVKDIDAGTSGSAPHGLANIGGTLYFEATVPGATSHTDLALYKSDGTDAGTVEVLDLGTNGGDFTQVGGKILFDSLSGLYAANDTNTGFVRLGPGALAVVFAASGNTFANELVVGGLLYYFSPLPQSSFPTSYLLYRSDGTVSGTYPIDSTTFKPYLPDGSLNLTLSGGTIYFAADAGDGAGTQLWKTDGTAAGTVRITDINAGLVGLNPTNLTDADGMLFFVANDGVHGQELWKSDGTTAGTVMVADIDPGSASSFTSASEIVAAGPALVFTANDGIHGTELWESDGTAAGTRLLDDIRPGGASSSPSWLYASNGLLFFSADDGMHGAEPWVLDLHGSISGSVFDDANHNGIRDPGEQSLPGVTVYLHREDNANGSAEMTTTSDADGNYTFAGLLPGRYGVGQLVPAGDALTAPLGYSGIVALLPARSTPGPVFGDVAIAAVPLDFDYLLTLAQHYGQPGTFATGDLNADAKVNFADLLLLAQHYGTTLASANALTTRSVIPMDSIRRTRNTTIRKSHRRMTPMLV